MPHILFDCERMKYPNTGLYTFCDELGAALLQQAQPEEELYFYIPPKLGKHFGKEAKYIWQHSLHKFYLPHRDQMDIWHTTYQSSPYRSPRKGSRKLLTIHDLNFLHEERAQYRARRYLSAIQRSIDEADQLVAISQFAKNEVMQYLDTQNKPFHVIYNGSTVDLFPGFDRPRYRPSAPFLFAMGTILPKKNFHVLPSLLAGGNMELLIAGNEHEGYCEQIMREAAKHGVKQQVKIIGPVTIEEKYWYLKNCEAFLFPSLAEGFGLPVIEAMHFGKPVFLSDKTSLPEVGGNTAYYFRDFDPAHMRQVFEEGMAHYEREKPVAAITAHAAQFNWNDAAAAYLQIYRELY